MIPHKLRDATILTALVLLTFIVRLPSLEEPFDNDSSANAYHAHLILQGEPLYSTHHPAHHMPGVYYTYVLAFALLGESDFSVKLFLIPWTMLTAWLVYKLGKQLEDRAVGVLAAAFFILLTSQLNLKGTTAELEMFANLPVVAAVYLALRYDKQKDHLIWLFWSGVLFGIVLAFKVSLFLFVIVVGVWLLSLFYQESRATNQWRQQLVALVRRGLVLLSGMVVITSLILALLAWQGVLQRFLLVFKMGESYLSYSSTLPVYRVILIPLIILAYNNAVLLVFSLVGLLRLGYAIRRGNVPSVPFYVALATWLLVSFVITGITRIGYVHYALIAVPPIVLVFALEIRRVSARIIERFKLKGRNQIIPQASILVLVIASSLVFNYSSPYHYLRYRLGLESFEDYLTEGTIEGTSLVNSLKVAKYIAQNTLSTDYIYNWSESPQIYYYSDRRSPIETIWPYYATAFGSYKRIFVPGTKYIILGHSIYAEVPDWMRAELAQNFYLETVIGDYQLYRRNVP